MRGFGVEGVATIAPGRALPWPLLADELACSDAGGAGAVAALSAAVSNTDGLDRARLKKSGVFRRDDEDDDDAAIVGGDVSRSGSSEGSSRDPLVSCEKPSPNMRTLPRERGRDGGGSSRALAAPFADSARKCSIDCATLSLLRP